MNRIPRRVFTAEYKSEAIKLAGAVGVPTAARQLDLATKSLYLWIKQSNEGKLKPSGPSKLTAEGWIRQRPVSCNRSTNACACDYRSLRSSQRCRASQSREYRSEADGCARPSVS